MREVTSRSRCQAVASKLDLPDDLVGYFSLFLVRETKDGAFSCEWRALGAVPWGLWWDVCPGRGKAVPCQE